MSNKASVFSKIYTCFKFGDIKRLLLVNKAVELFLSHLVPPVTQPADNEQDVRMFQKKLLASLVIFGCHVIISNIQVKIASFLSFESIDSSIHSLSIQWSIHTFIRPWGANFDDCQPISWKLGFLGYETFGPSRLFAQILARHAKFCRISQVCGRNSNENWISWREIQD